MPRITLLGDSTLDNRIWVDGLIKNWLYTRIGIKHDTAAQRIQQFQRGLIKPELSVIENLSVQLGDDYQIYDGTNDGFTSRDVLSGQFRSKVFGPNTFSMFPPVYFSPLDAHAEDIRQSDVIVLSVGGNDVREFLQNTFRTSEEERIAYIRNEFPGVLKRLKAHYLGIIKEIRKLNPEARLVLMTQYYPSISQNNYGIYEFMGALGRALWPKESQLSPTDVIQRLVADTYRSIFEALTSVDENANFVVADITSSLNPYDGMNHTHQIEPSGQGGSKIAKMLHFLITHTVPSGNVYRFEPAFFQEDFENEFVKVRPVDGEWLPLHPNEIQESEVAYSLAYHPPEAQDNSFIINAIASFADRAYALLVLFFYSIGEMARNLGAGLSGICQGVDNYVEPTRPTFSH
jgi:hypothetical protein